MERLTASSKARVNIYSFFLKPKCMFIVCGSSQGGILKSTHYNIHHLQTCTKVFIRTFGCLGYKIHHIPICNNVKLCTIKDLMQENSNQNSQAIFNNIKSFNYINAVQAVFRRFLSRPVQFWKNIVHRIQKPRRISSISLAFS